MRIRPMIWCLAMLIFAVSFCIFQIGSRQLQADPTDPSNEPNTAALALREQLTPEQKEAIKQRKAKFNAAWRESLATNYKAKLNNGSKRQGATLEELPAEVQQAAAEVAREYTEVIYPALKKHLAENELLPIAPLPGLEKYMMDPEYKGTGPKLLGRNSWAIGIRWRLDGTMVARDVYSQNPPNAPHDVWADNTRFASLKHGFVVTGWDDGRVTFDFLNQMYRRQFQSPVGLQQGTAAPGQAGIPPETFKMRSPQQKAKPASKVEGTQTEEQGEQNSSLKAKEESP